MDVASASPRRYFFEARTLYVLTLLVFFAFLIGKFHEKIATASLYYVMFGFPLHPIGYAY
jgi:hypothetical protein